MATEALGAVVMVVLDKEEPRQVTLPGFVRY